MGKRQRDWAKKAYDKLILELGGKCVKCDTLSGLTIDHIDGRDWLVEEYEWSHRISIYRNEAKKGLLQVLCNKCNVKKGDSKAKIEMEFDHGQLDLFTYTGPADPNDPF